ncbi:hypothetical protein ACJJTC_013354 [Scirpophaga incertulas]
MCGQVSPVKGPQSHAVGVELNYTKEAVCRKGHPISIQYILLLTSKAIGTLLDNLLDKLQDFWTSFCLGIGLRLKPKFSIFVIVERWLYLHRRDAKHATSKLKLHMRKRKTAAQLHSYGIKCSMAGDRL